MVPESLRTAWGSIFTGGFSPGRLRPFSDSLALSVKSCGFASSPKGRALGKAAKFTAIPTAPPGGAVAQRLRGHQSAEPKKTVKRSSRQSGVNLQFFPVEPTSLGLSRASSPGIGLRLPASASCLERHLRLAGRCPNNCFLFPPLAAVAVVALWGGWSPEEGRGESEHPSLPLAQRSVPARWKAAEASHCQGQRFPPQTTKPGGPLRTARLCVKRSCYSSILPKLKSAKSSTRSVRLGATGAAVSASRGA